MATTSDASCPCSRWVGGRVQLWPGGRWHHQQGPACMPPHLPLLAQLPIRSLACQWQCPASSTAACFQPVSAPCTGHASQVHLRAMDGASVGAAGRRLRRRQGLPTVGGWQLDTSPHPAPLCLHLRALLLPPQLPTQSTRIGAAAQAAADFCCCCCCCCPCACHRCRPIVDHQAAMKENMARMKAAYGASKAAAAVAAGGGGEQGEQASAGAAGSSGGAAAAAKRARKK